MFSFQLFRVRKRGSLNLHLDYCLLFPTQKKISPTNRVKKNDHKQMNEKNEVWRKKSTSSSTSCFSLPWQCCLRAARGRVHESLATFSQDPYTHTFTLRHIYTVWHIHTLQYTIWLTAYIKTGVKNTQLI